MAGTQNTQESALSSGSAVKLHSFETAEMSHPNPSLTNPLNVLNMTEGSSCGPNPPTSSSLCDPTNQLPAIMPVSQLQGYRNVMIKPIAPKQQSLPLQPSAAMQTGSTSGFRPLPQQGHIPSQSQLASLSSPTLHPTVSSFPMANNSIIPPSHSVPVLSSQNSRTSISAANAVAKTHEGKNLSLQGGGGGVSANKPRKPCNCKNSQCLKLYCDCFANGEFCRESCNCQNCKNNRQHEEDRTKAVKACLERNPNAFKPKVGHGQVGDGRRHIKGCNCKKSGCLKNYCECYEAKIPCSYLCRCVGCQNLSDRPEGKGLMELANAADLRTQQQRAASTHFLEQIETPIYNQRPSDGQKLPYAFVNKEITKATALCLLEEASHAASSGQSSVDVERAVLIEFGRCLEQIINSSESANQNIRDSMIGMV